MHCSKGDESLNQIGRNKKRKRIHFMIQSSFTLKSLKKGPSKTTWMTTSFQGREHFLDSVTKSTKF